RGLGLRTTARGCQERRGYCKGLDTGRVHLILLAAEDAKRDLRPTGALRRNRLGQGQAVGRIPGLRRRARLGTIRTASRMPGIGIGPARRRGLVAMELTLVPLDGRVELKGLLGSGGMGEVHRGWDRTLERPVAVKFVLGPGPQGEGRLLLEARLQARVEH